MQWFVTFPPHTAAAPQSGPNPHDARRDRSRRRYRPRASRRTRGAARARLHSDQLVALAARGRARGPGPGADRHAAAGAAGLPELCAVEHLQHAAHAVQGARPIALVGLPPEHVAIPQPAEGPMTRVDAPPYHRPLRQSSVVPKPPVQSIIQSPSQRWPSGEHARERVAHARARRRAVSAGRDQASDLRRAIDRDDRVAIIEVLQTVRDRRNVGPRRDARVRVDARAREVVTRQRPRRPRVAGYPGVPRILRSAAR